MINFYSIHFVLFLLIVLICYYTIFRKKQWICLLIASAYFYYWTSIRNFVFILVVGISTWIGAKWIEKIALEYEQVRKNTSIEKIEKEKKKDKIKKKKSAIMWSVVVLNFGMLTCIKYAKMQALGIVLPLGISFYMFQSIGYLIDVYNQKYETEKNFAKYMLFVSYFPQLIQGPINRYDALGPQISKEQFWNGERMTKALYRIGYGLLKKFAIANVYVGIISNILDKTSYEYSGATILFGILLYSIQQYADFSGGIDIVLGVSELFGIHLAENFRQPYFSVSLADFWRRWHMSLGKWMRDYVFYPFALTKPIKKLGKWASKNIGKHMGRVLPAAIGNILVFTVVGLWHGFEGHYILWGLYNGLVIAISDFLVPCFDKMKQGLKIRENAFGYRVFQIARTFLIVNIGWYFDRIEDVGRAFLLFQKTILEFDIAKARLDIYVFCDQYSIQILVLSIIACIIVLGVSVLEECNINTREALYKKPLLVKWAIYFILIAIIIVAESSVVGTGGFMYANF